MNIILKKYLAITFMVTYPAWGLLAVGTQWHIISFSDTVGTLLHMIGGFGPTVAALLLVKENKRSILQFVFHYEHKSMKYMFMLMVMEIAVFALSSQELNAALPLYQIPFIFLQAVFIYGGEEEWGWRGIMQPVLEKKFHYFLACLITGLVWGLWHIPLWFVEGSSQQNMPFVFFVSLAIILSIFLAALYKKTKCIFACSVFLGLTNTLLSMFVIKLNIGLIFGLAVMMLFSLSLLKEKDF